MGVGTPANILEAIERGIDMFDCVMPTRNGRNGMIFTSDGIINIRNRKWSDDFTPLDKQCPSGVSKNYTKAYLRHLVISGEMLGAQIASIHNLSFYMNLVNEARNRIEKGDFLKWKNSIIKKVSGRL
jgi:queuine tRNA-ribosyltransferase